MSVRLHANSSQLTSCDNQDFSSAVMGVNGRNMCVAFSGATQSNGQAVISAHAGDEGQTLLSKGLPRNTLVYARNGAGQLLPCMVAAEVAVKLPDDFERHDLLTRVATEWRHGRRGTYYRTLSTQTESL